MEEQDGRRRRQQENISVLYWSVRTRNSLPPSSSRSFRTQSCWSFITGQCLDCGRFLQAHFITLDVQSIYISSSIQDWHREVKIWAIDRQYSLCLWILWTKNTEILRQYLKAPRLARYMHKAPKKHQNTVFWVDIKLAQKGLKFYQTRPNAIILHNTLPAYCIPKVVRMETGVIIYEKVYESPRPPPKISLRHDWMKELGSEVARQAEVNQPTEPNPNPNHDRTGRPVVTEQTSRSSAQEIDTRFSRDCNNTNLYVERSVKDKDKKRRCRSWWNGETRCDWTTIRFVHTVKRGGHWLQSIWIATCSCQNQAANSRVRELVKKIESLQPI